MSCHRIHAHRARSPRSPTLSPSPRSQQLLHDGGDTFKQVPFEIAVFSIFPLLQVLSIKEVNTVLASEPNEIIASWEHVARVVPALEDNLVVNLGSISPINESKVISVLHYKKNNKSTRVQTLVDRAQACAPCG
jgi:hypothetical protein